MRLKRALTLAGMPLIGAGLSGCIAAAAIPVVATGAIGRTATDGEPGPSVEVEESAPVEASEAVKVVEAATAPDADTASAEAEATELAEVPEAPSIIETVAIPASVPTEAADTPQPTRATPSMQGPQLSQFVRYSTLQAFRFSDANDPLDSAVLVNPASLDGRRVICNPGDRRDPSILIDLDPSGAVFSEDAPLPTSSTIALSLRVLRAEGVEIAWISENSAASADFIREALSELDPDAKDTLLLMRYPGDRKQTRREEFARETCLLAIAGDEREDFDELYEYLTNPNAALALEPMFNNGWFILTAEAPAPVEQEIEKEAPSPAEVPAQPAIAQDQLPEEPAPPAPQAEVVTGDEATIAAPAQPRQLGEVQGPADIPDETPAEAAARLLGKPAIASDEEDTP